MSSIQADTFRNQFGIRLKEYKLKNGYADDESFLSDLNDKGEDISHKISLETLRKAMRGGTSPSIETLFCLAKLGVSIDWLLTGKQLEPKNRELWEELDNKLKGLVENVRGGQDETVDEIASLYKGVKPENKETVSELLRLVGRLLSEQ